MYGAILGDIIGSPYEFHPVKTTAFPLFTPESTYTDDTVMTIAVADALMEVTEDMPEDVIREKIIRSLRWFGRRHPHAGYGGTFRKWLKAQYPKPYNSWGNGSAMRVSAVGWLYPDLETTLKMARLSAEVTHNHPQGIIGAQATAAAVWMARRGHTPEQIRSYIEETFHYDLRRTCDAIRPEYDFDVSCQGSVPEAIIAALESESYEDAVRRAVSLGGDADTQAAIAGSIAEARFGIPPMLREECAPRLPEDLREVLLRFEKRIQG